VRFTTLLTLRSLPLRRGTPMSVLEFILRLPEVICLLLAAAKYWRVSVSLLIAACVVIVICYFWDALPIRVIAGFHILVFFTTAGVMWETNRQG
jgi:hypothetical protein